MPDLTNIETGETQFRLAEAYIRGFEGSECDWHLASALYEKCANLGNVEAQFRLGCMYSEETDPQFIKIDYEKAAKWMLMAAENKHEEAYSELGWMYYRGDGVQEDDKEAEKWLLKAADNGERNVSYALGRIYSSGAGVPTNKIKAYMWLWISQQGREFIGQQDMEEIVSLKQTMSPEDIEKAVALADDWTKNIMTLEPWERTSRETGEEKFEFLTPEGAKERASAFDFSNGALTYILWDRTEIIEGLTGRPLYVGTAKNRSRIRGHASKDHGKATLARRSNPPLADFVEAKAESYGPGWLRFTLRPHPNIDAAKQDERQLINKWGIRKLDGILFNQSLTG
jgi:hypothetical protein